MVLTATLLPYSFISILDPGSSTLAPSWCQSMISHASPGSHPPDAQKAAFPCWCLAATVLMPNNFDTCLILAASPSCCSNIGWPFCWILMQSCTWEWLKSNWWKSKKPKLNWDFCEIIFAKFYFCSNRTVDFQWNRKKGEKLSVTKKWLHILERCIEWLLVVQMRLTLLILWMTSLNEALLSYGVYNAALQRHITGFRVEIALHVFYTFSLLIKKIKILLLFLGMIFLCVQEL